MGVLATAAVTGIGFAVGGTVGAQVMAAIGINLSSEIIQNGYARMKESWLAGPDGVLNHDIQRALGRAFGKALVSLETKYFQLPEAAALPREERKSVSALFKSLREHAPESFMALVGEASGDAELKGYLYGEPEAATEKLFGRINATEALDGFPAHFKNFLRQNLLGELVFWFGEELKTDSKESNKAWRAFQRLLLEGIQADVRAVRDGVTEVRLNQQAIQDDLRTLDQLRAQLDQLRDTVERRLPDEMFQRVVEKAFGDVMSLLSRIDAKVDTIRRDVQLLRQEREREDDGRPSPAEFDARLSQIRRNVLSGPSPWELQQSLYQVEELGQWYQHHPELRSLQDQIKLAIAR
ncbi:MAG TPA: hypothetical protein VEQ42_10070, partial [Pyrinomonadaceae bacterium]|nr:hypothetical protein [Pyrinomonadaceae bacterium]